LPAYNCRSCKGLVDPTETVRCPQCNEKNPLLCSKCNAPINHHDIHEIEKLKVKKPLLCKSCGGDNQVLKCALCNIGLVRSQGETVSPLEGAKVYHKKCLAKRREAVNLAHKTAPAAAGICLLLGGILAATGTKMLAGAAAAVGLALFIGIKVFATIIEPR
jgi:DNA-directed RNA polymerase subunit RPC12/RpoP